jgi:hypothetical protein
LYTDTSPALSEREMMLFLHNDDQLCPGALSLLANACVSETDPRVKLWFGTHLIMDAAGVVDPERSAASDQWFGRQGPGATRPVWEWCLTESIPPDAFLVERATYLQYMRGERDGNVGDWAFSVRLANSGGWAPSLGKPCPATGCRPDPSRAPGAASTLTGPTNWRASCACPPK